MTINCNAVADRSVTSSPKLYLKTLLLLLLLHLGLVAAAQDDTYEGGDLEEVTVTEEEARSLIHQLLDVKRFTHSFGVGRIAKDERLIAFAEGFVERNEIEVLTIGYIDSEEFWPRIFKNIRLKKIDKANTDLLLTGHIMFIPVTDADGSITAYTVELKLEGKTTEVYELLEVSQTDIELIAQETTTERLGDKPYTTPADAQREVADAMIAALQKVEGKGDTTDQNIQLVSFRADPYQKFGFDAPQHTQLNNDYPTVTVGGSSSRTSWKSLKSNSTDQVIAIGAGDQDLTFELDGAPVTATAGDNNSYNLTIMGSSDGVTGELLAKVGTATAGKLNTISYDLSEIKVKIVPVNNAISPSELSLLQDTLNKIYAPAIASWHVEVLENQNLGTDWDDEGNGLEDGETGMLSNYTKEMNDLIKAFKDKTDRDKDAYYVFLVDRAENASKKGYMPRKKQWGFVFTDSHSGVEDITTTIAHELGHGVYRLEHIFSEKGIPKGQSRNLMDYARGKDLYKFQWDYVHNPASVITLFDDEEDASLAGEVWLTPDWKAFSVDGTNTVSARQSSYKVPGTIPGFKKNGVTYWAMFQEETFLGYYANGEISEDSKYEVIEIDKSLLEEIYLYQFNGGCGLDKYYKTTPEYVEGNKGPALFANLNNGIVISCSENQLTYFVNESSAYVNYFIDKNKKIAQNLHEDDELVSSLTAVVNTMKSTSGKNDEALGIKLADKLKTYEIFNNKKFIVAPLEMNSLSINQKSWEQLAEVIFEKAGLANDAILITLPYVQCEGIGNDQGVYYFMPGLAHGPNVEIDVDELKNDYKNTQDYSAFTSTEKYPVGRFILDVFTHTKKNVVVYKGIFNASNTIDVAKLEGYISGTSYNKTIELWRDNSFRELAQLYDNYVSAEKAMQDAYKLNRTNYSPSFLSNSLRTLELNFRDGFANALERLSSSVQLEKYEPQKEGHNDSYVVFREEFLEETYGSNSQNNAEHYIMNKAFEQVQKNLGYAYSGNFNYNRDDHTLNRDFWTEVVDPLVYGTLDASSLIVGFVLPGYDLIPDGIGFFYSAFRGDIATNAEYSIAVIIPTAAGSPIVIKQTLQKSSKALLKIVRKETIEAVSSADGILYDMVGDMLSKSKISQSVYDDLMLKSGEDLSTSISLIMTKGNLLEAVNGYSNLSVWLKQLHDINDRALIETLGDLADDLNLSKLNQDLVDESYGLALKNAFEEDPELVGIWNRMEKTEISDSFRKNPEALSKAKSFYCN